MKEILKIALALIIGICSLSACEDEEQQIIGFTADKHEITIGSIGGIDTINIISESVWVAISSEPWITISPANGIGNTTCEIVIDSTLRNDMRSATIRFSPVGLETTEVQVYQTGFDKQIIIAEPEIEIESSEKADKRKFKTKITTNVEFNITVEYDDEESVKWLTVPKYTIELERGARPRTLELEFEWKMNPDFRNRVAKIHFTPANEEDELKEQSILTVTQKAAPIIEDNRGGDSLALITIAERVGYLVSYDNSENMRNWQHVKLWEVTDTALPCADAVGRVREYSFFMVNTKESIPQEVKYLKYAEKISFYGNVNTMLLSIPLDTHLCNLEYLKELEIGAYGLVSLPDELTKLGNTLEVLNLSSNNFDNIPEILTPENFPKLKSLNLIANKRWTMSDLRKVADYADRDGVGMHINTTSNGALERLLRWDNLEELRLSNNYIEGQLPDFRIGVDGVEGYTQEDADKFGGDTLKNIVNSNIPKILPNMKLLSINLNYFTGEAPAWLLYHPHLLDWFPESLIFMQNEGGIDSNGKVVGFSNTPKDFEYYYTFFPGYKDKYELKEEWED
ncbi:MAG: hypothetical protein J6K74_07020 [Marinifilaceae bacterium]|nr:hypothetical protein [Marinifilaceae bacterium]